MRPSCIAGIINPVRILLFVFLIADAISVRAIAKPPCLGGNGFFTRHFASFEIRISPYHKGPETHECKITVRDEQKRQVFAEYDWGLSIIVLGDDVNGDGLPDLVVEGYSGGAHCCWTYSIVSLGSTAGLIRKFQNDRPASFAPDPTGRFEIRTLDGAFDYFDFFSHAETVFPNVYLRLDGHELSNIAPNHRQDYDREIRQAQRRLSREQINSFRSAKSREELTGDPDRGLAEPVLTIILAYLYSGRAAKAHQELRTMWPSFDQERIWTLILRTQQKGILHYTRLASENP